MTDSIFSKIIRHEIPAHRVYEDEHCIAILDIAPLSLGHTLVIPKEPAETLDQLSDSAAAGVGKALPRICRAILKVTGATAYNVLQNNGQASGQTVPHVHFHIIPRTTAPSAGLGLDWRPTKGEPDALADLGRSIARLL
jgi:histidine triad (HIT) family protein